MRLPGSCLSLLIVFTASAAVAAPTCGELAPHGLPADTGAPPPNTVTVCEQSPDQTVAFFVTDYDRDAVAPRWVAYALTRAEMLKAAKSTITRKKDGVPFAADPAIETDSFKSPADRDYKYMKIHGVAYDRGHYAPADAMKWSLDAYHATFTVANIAPQVHAFNAGVWARLETQVRGWACDHGPVYVITGVTFGGSGSTVFRPKKRPDLKIKVPVHFWKAVYTPGDGGKAIAFIFPNTTHPGTLENAARSVRQLEALTGLNFNPDLAKSVADQAETAAPDLNFWALKYKARFKCE